MIQRQSISIFLHSSADDRELGSFLSYLKSMPHIRLESAAHLPDDLTPYDVAITSHQPFPERTASNLTEFACNGGEWLMLVRLADHLLLGELLAAPLADSVKVVAILEAAGRSMANGGSAEVLNAGSN